MGDDFYETNYGTECEHNDWKKDYPPLRDDEYCRDVWFRKCNVCGTEQVGISWNGYQQHGIDYWDRDSDAIKSLLKKLGVEE